MTDRLPLTLTVDAAAELLHLPKVAVDALLRGGYLVPHRDGPGGPEVALSDLKAFGARNADNGAGVGILDRVLAPALRRTRSSDELMDLISDRSGEMARRVFDIFVGVFPEAGEWAAQERTEFIEQARGRFEAILAVAAQGTDVDGALFDDLRAIGASAARAGSSLPQLLAVLRITRDLVVQTAIEESEGWEMRGGEALSVLLTRVLPTIDRLTDALSQGYWETILAGA